MNDRQSGSGDAVSGLRPWPWPWWQGATLYQIYPRSFLDTNGDGVGDLAGVTAKLDHVASLGVDGVWISPFYRSPMKDFGYDIADHKAVDPIFGDIGDFDALVARAHGLGLKVIVDQVYSHTSDQHDWFRASRSSRTGPYSDWFVWADAKADGTPPSNWQSVFGGPAWTWDSRRGQYYLHNFLSDQPALNVHNPAVQDAQLEVTRFWLDRGVDGLRLDAINFAMADPALRDNPPAPDDGRRRTRPFDFQREVYNRSHPALVGFVERIRATTDAYPGRFTVAEVAGPEPLDEMRLLTAPPRRLDSAYGFNFLYAEGLTPQRVRDAMAGWPARPDVGWPSWAFSNHDAPRHVSRWAPAARRAEAARLFSLLLVALRGNIFLYQGEELGLPQATIAFEDLRDPEAIANWPLTLGRDGARTPMPWRSDGAHAGFTDGKPWLPICGEHLALAVDEQNPDPGSQLALTRRLIALRRERAILRLGDFRVTAAEGDLLVFERALDGERLLCAFNLGAGAVAWTPDRPGDWRVLTSVNDARPGSLPPWGGLIAEPVGQPPEPPDPGGPGGVGGDPARAGLRSAGPWR